MKVDLLPEQMTRLVRRVFADAEITSCRLTPAAPHHTAYDLVLSNLTTPVRLKLYSEDDERQTLRKEIHLLGILTSETGVPVPRVLHFEEHLPEDGFSSMDSCPWTLHTRLPGQPLSQLVDAMDKWEQESIGYEMGRYLAHIHRIPVDEFGELFVPGPYNRGSEQEYVLSQSTAWLDICTETARLPPNTIQALLDHLTQTEILNRSQACLIHGEYTPENIVVEHGATGYHVTGVLGFAYAQGGSPEQDMSKLFVHSLHNSPTLQKGFLDGYTESGELGATFWERMELYKLFSCLQAICRTVPSKLADTCTQYLIDKQL